MLHIGDIHFPEIDENERPLYKRDGGFHPKMDEILPKASYMIILDDLLEEIDKNPSAILFSGDLTTGGIEKGGIKGFEECLDFLKLRIPPPYFDEDNQRIFIVPGNHDVDREKRSESSLITKFEPIKESISKKEFPEIPVSEATFKIVKNQNSSSSISIISINSCVGCGEIRYFPEEIQKPISELFEKFKSERTQKLMERIYNELDIPVIEEQDITNSIKFIEKNETCLPIFLTHHNLLPHRIVREVMYSELLNGGHLRNQLLTLNKPIIFLHGHIHDDSIEIIESTQKYSKIICISAPLFLPIKGRNVKNIGFNKIRIVFENEVLIGCEIELHRLNGAKMEKRKERIHFWTPPDTVALLTSQDEKIFSYVDDKKVYLNKIKNRYNESIEKKITIDEVEACMDKLSWLGLVDYKERDAPKEMRYVGKVMP